LLNKFVIFSRSIIRKIACGVIFARIIFSLKENFLIKSVVTNISFVSLICLSFNVAQFATFFLMILAEIQNFVNNRIIKLREIFAFVKTRFVAIPFHVSYFAI